MLIQTSVNESGKNLFSANINDKKLKKSLLKSFFYLIALSCDYGIFGSDSAAPSYHVSMELEAFTEELNQIIDGLKSQLNREDSPFITYDFSEIKKNILNVIEAFTGEQKQIFFNSMKQLIEAMGSKEQQDNFTENINSLTRYLQSIEDIKSYIERAEIKSNEHIKKILECNLIKKTIDESTTKDQLINILLNVCEFELIPEITEGTREQLIEIFIQYIKNQEESLEAKNEAIKNKLKLMEFISKNLTKLNDDQLTERFTRFSYGIKIFDKILSTHREIYSIFSTHRALYYREKYIQQQFIKFLSLEKKPDSKTDKEGLNIFFEIITLFKKLEAQKMDYIIDFTAIVKDFFDSLDEITDINQRQDFSYSVAELIKTITNKGDLNLYFEDHLDVFISVDDNIEQLRSFLSAFKNCLSSLNSRNNEKEKIIQLFVELMKVINQEDGFDENLKSATTILYTFERNIINSSVHDCFFDLIKFIVDQPLDISRNINSLASFSRLIRRYQSDNKTEKILFFEDIKRLMKNFVKKTSEPLTEQLEKACDVLTSDYAENLQNDNVYALVDILSFEFKWIDHLKLHKSFFDIILDQPLNRRDIRKNIKSLKDFTQLISIIGNQIKENSETDIQLFVENIKKIMEIFVDNKSEPLISKWSKACNTLKSFYPKEFRFQEIEQLNTKPSYEIPKQHISQQSQQHISQQEMEHPILRPLKDENIQRQSANHVKLAEDLVSKVSDENIQPQSANHVKLAEEKTDSMSLDRSNYRVHKNIDPQLKLSKPNGKNFSKGQQKQEPMSYDKKAVLFFLFSSGILSKISPKSKQIIQNFMQNLKLNNKK